MPSPVKLAVVASIGGIIWFIIGTIATGWTSWGDGSVHPATSTQKIGYYMPSAYCFAIAFSCFSVVRGIFALIVGVGANLMLVAIVTVMLKGLNQWSRGDFVINVAVVILPLLYLDFQWFALFRKRWRE